jgi:hypothetical protein
MAFVTFPAQSAMDMQLDDLLICTQIIAGGIRLKNCLGETHMDPPGFMQGYLMPNKFG